jgi:type I restriction enzyme M protein
LIDFRETEHSKIFLNEAFGYYKITVERPLRLKIDLSAENLSKFCRTCGKEGESDLAEFISDFAKEKRATSFSNYNEFIELVEERANKLQLKLTKKRKDLIRNELATIDESAEPVIKKVHKPGKVTQNHLEGLYELIVHGKKCIIEYESDSNLRDTEQVPLLEQGGIEAFFKREVLPYAADAWVDNSKTQIGYEISFTKHFYKPAKMRSLEEIQADILKLENETSGLLSQIVGAHQ